MVTVSNGDNFIIFLRVLDQVIWLVNSPLGTSRRHGDIVGGALSPKAAQPGQAAEGVATRAIGARLHDLARGFGRLGDAAETLCDVAN
jgi:hypothetical protein